MPGWLQVVAHANPLSYEVQGMRDLLLGIPEGGALWLDFTVVAGFLVASALVAAKTYPGAILYPGVRSCIATFSRLAHIRSTIGSKSSHECCGARPDPGLAARRARAGMLKP